MPRPLSLLLTVVGLFFGLAAFADALTLSSGKRVEGTVLDETPDAVMFQSKSGKKYRIPRAKLQRVERDGEASRSPASSESGEVAETVSSPSAPSALRMGLILGPSFSSMSFSSGISPDSRTGLCTGVHLEVPVWKFLYFTPELNYEQLGFSFGILTASADLHYNILRVPLLLDAKLEAAPYPFAFHVYLGPSVGIRLSASSSITNNGNTTTSDLGNSTESLDLGLAFGTAFEYHITPTLSVLAQVRYELGLTNILKPTTTTATAQSVSAKTRDTQLLAGVLYKF